MNADKRRLGVEERAARAAESVPGLAFLSPGLAGMVLTSAQRLAGGTGGTPRPHGVRAHWDGATARWEIEVQCAVRRGHRALDVAREVRAAVLAAFAGGSNGAAARAASDEPCEVDETPSNAEGSSKADVNASAAPGEAGTARRRAAVGAVRVTVTHLA